MPTSPFMQHYQLWHACTKCGLCEGRQKVVLARGRVPADILFIGEAPGQSEDVLGRPFVGPAGKLLDQIVASALDGPSPEWQKRGVAFTNLVACIPLGEDGDKVKEPEPADIMACQSRLEQFVQVCKPKLAVLVGALASKWVNKQRASYGLGDTRLVDIIHPAAILRANIVQRGLMVQRCIVALANAAEELQRPQKHLSNGAS